MSADNTNAANGDVLFHSQPIADVRGLVTPATTSHNLPMDQSDTNAICNAFQGATLEFPFGPEPNVWKVGNKIFAITNAPNGVSLKCADAPTADLLIDMGRASKAPYLPRGGWVLIEWGMMEAGELAERLKTSYDTVRASLTKKAQAELG